MNKQPKKKSGRKPGKPAKKRPYNKKAAPPTANGAMDDPEFYVGPIEDTPYAGRMIIHPAYDLAKSYVAELKQGQSFTVSKKFRLGLNRYITSQYPQRVYRAAKVVGNDKVVRFSRVK